MPTPYLEKLSKEGHGSIESLERKWDEAKKRAASEGRKDDYAYITGILKHMIGASVETADGINDVSVPVATDNSNPADRDASFMFEGATPVKPGSPREVAAKNKTAAIATKLLVSHLRAARTLVIKGLTVTHSWGSKPARSFANPHFAYTALIPAKGFAVLMADQMAAARDVKSIYKEIGPVMVHGTPHGMLVAIPFNTGLAHSELMDDLYS